MLFGSCEPEIWAPAACVAKIMCCQRINFASGTINQIEKLKPFSSSLSESKLKQAKATSRLATCIEEGKVSISGSSR